jgi:prolyl 4-hydroxylase
MIEHNINKLNNFICGWYLEDTSICEVLIDYFENSPNKIQGRFSNNVVDTSQKKSVDVGLSDSNLINLYHFYYVKPILDHYKEKYQYCNAYSPWGLVETSNIQKYNPGDAFYAWHTERDTAQSPMAQRHLVFMTFLNDVEQGGEIEFFYQKIKIKPEKGLTLIWPADWCFTHRGLPALQEVKYIYTGWYNYILHENN